MRVSAHSDHDQRVRRQRAGLARKKFLARARLHGGHGAALRGARHHVRLGRKSFRHAARESLGGARLRTVLRGDGRFDARRVRDQSAEQLADQALVAVKAVAATRARSRGHGPGEPVSVAAPCTGPVLSVLLTFIAQSGSTTFGFFLMLGFALGLGIPFLVLATVSKLAFPRRFRARAAGWTSSKVSLLRRWSASPSTIYSSLRRVPVVPVVAGALAAAFGLALCVFGSGCVRVSRCARLAPWSRAWAYCLCSACVRQNRTPTALGTRCRRRSRGEGGAQTRDHRFLCHLVRRLRRARRENLFAARRATRARRCDHHQSRRHRRDRRHHRALQNLRRQRLAHGRLRQRRRRNPRNAPPHRLRPPRRIPRPALQLRRQVSRFQFFAKLKN